MDLVNSLKTRVDQLRGTDLEKKVKEATSNENWGASSTLMAEIARATYDYEGYKEVVPLMWKRMSESSVNWRIVFKSLSLLDYLIRNGSERVVNEAQDRLFQIRNLRDFQFVDEGGVDRGSGVREKAKQLMDLLNDKSRVDEARDKARKLQNKYMGVSNDGATTYAGTGSGSERYSGRGGYDQDPRWDARDSRDRAARSGGDSSWKEDMERDLQKSKKKSSEKKSSHKSGSRHHDEEVGSDDHEEEKPKKKSTKHHDEDNDSDKPKKKSTKKRVDDDDEDEKPSRSRKHVEREESPVRSAPAGPSGSEDEDDKPKKSKKKPSSSTKTKPSSSKKSKDVESEEEQEKPKKASKAKPKKAAEENDFDAAFDDFQSAPTSAPAPAAAAKRNDDFGFDDFDPRGSKSPQFSQPARASAQNDDWGDFGSGSAQPVQQHYQPAPQQYQPAPQHYQPAPQAYSQPAFGGSSGKAPLSAFDVFDQASPVAGNNSIDLVSAVASSRSGDFDDFHSANPAPAAQKQAPQQQGRGAAPSNAGSQAAAGKKSNDIWDSGLVNLGGLSLKESEQPKASKSNSSSTAQSGPYVDLGPRRGAGGPIPHNSGDPFAALGGGPPAPAPANPYGFGAPPAAPNPYGMPPANPYGAPPMGYPPAGPYGYPPPQMGGYGAPPMGRGGPAGPGPRTGFY